MNNKYVLIKETPHFMLFRTTTDNPYAIFHDKDSCNFYILSKDYGTVETGVDSLPMALMYLHQAEMGYVESLQLFNNTKEEEKEIVTAH